MVQVSWGADGRGFQGPCMYVWSPPPHLSSFASLRCYLLDGISKGAWLNRSSIIFAGSDKWSVDPRVSIVSSVADKHEYSLQIQKVDVTDDGQYTCSIQSERNLRPKHLNLVVKGGWWPSERRRLFFWMHVCQRYIVSLSPERKCVF